MKAFFDSVKIVIGELGWNDIIDILAIAYIIYKLATFIRDSRASLIVKGVLLIAVAYVASVALELQMVSTVVEMIVRYAAIAIIVVLQPEIRSMLERVGRSRLKVSSLFDRSEDEKKRGDTLNTISSVVESTRILQKQCMGALIVFERDIPLQEIVETGTKMDAAPNVQLIANIFFNKAPLHDGAMVIQNNRITAASCILPLTQNTDIDPSFGTRHRAAIGMSENSDAAIVVVSEETGRISVACNGVINSTYDPGELSSMLMPLLLPDSESSTDDDSSLKSKAAAFLRRRSGSQNEEQESENADNAKAKNNSGTNSKATRSGSGAAGRGKKR